MNIPLYSVRLDFGVKASRKKMDNIYRQVKRMVESLEEEDDTFLEVPGRTRVFAESSSNEQIKDWSLSIVSPALLENHPLRYRLEGLGVTLFHTKYFYSKEFKFNQVNKK